MINIYSLPKKVEVKILLLYFLMILGACNRSSNDPQPTGPVSPEEISSLPSITFDQLNKAYEFVIQEDPSLLQNEEKLSRAVFNRLKSHPNGRLKSPDTADEFSLLTRMTLEELKVVFKHMLSWSKLRETVNASLNAARSEFHVIKIYHMRMVKQMLLDMPIGVHSW